MGRESLPPEVVRDVATWVGPGVVVRRPRAPRRVLDVRNAVRLGVLIRRLTGPRRAAPA